MASPIRLRAAADMWRLLPLVSADASRFGLPGLRGFPVPRSAAMARVVQSRWCGSILSTLGSRVPHLRRLVSFLSFPRAHARG